MVWLCSPHDSCKAPYLYAHISMTSAYISSVIISILPVKSCRQRRHFSPQMRVNRSVFLNLPILKPRRTSRRNDFASFSFTCGLRHPTSSQQVTAAWAQALPQRRARHSRSSFLLAFQGYAPQLKPSRGALYVISIAQTWLGRSIDRLRSK